MKLKTQNITFLFSATREQQMSEISQLESLVSSSQELVRKQTRRYMEQMDKLVMSDTTIEQLMVDNKKLTEEINVIKQKCQLDDRNTVRLTVGDDRE